MVDKLLTATFLLIFFIIIRLTVKLPFNGLKSIGILTLLAAFIILIQTLFGPGTQYIINPLFPHTFPVVGGMGSLKWEGFFLGIIIICRLTVLLLMLPLFTETTKHDQIALSLCDFGFNYRIAFIITTAFNLIPLFKEEAILIMEAQKLRGMSLSEKRNFFSFFSGIRVYAGLLIPLMLGAMRKAQKSSIAMDSRAFGIYKTRTWLERPLMKVTDYWFMAACIVFTAGFLVFNFYLS